ncbi:MAG: tRNA-dihydrouridine synthase family protein [Chloroflexi bacterium]|nr:MAG: tRNA-dihydrouridine synthase family protein [Chloroflexota bacterium]
MNKQPAFYVRDIPVYGDVILSPMAGYSDVPYRALCRAYGSAMHYTEFVPVEALLGREIHPRYRRLLDKKPDEHPMVFQIFGNDARKILEAALRIEPLGADIVDINMGCSTRKVSGRGAGVGMMRQPALVAETFRLLTSHLSVPVTAKIRLGWDEDERNFLEIGRILEDNGVALIAIHARTKVQRYGGKADWDAIAALKQVVSVPVVGNGDVCVAADIDRMKAYTGCDGVMIGRAAIGNPWIFARRDKNSLCFGDLLATVRLHLQEMLAYYGFDGVVLFRKHLKRYFEGMTVCAPFLSRLLVANDGQLVGEILAEMETAVSPGTLLAELLNQPAPTAPPAALQPTQTCYVG